MTKQPIYDQSNLNSHQMGLGAWAWGDRIVWNYGRDYSDIDIANAFRASVSLGITLVDTAEVYGNGRSEVLLGKFIRETDKPILVATKYFPFPWRFGSKSILRALESSLTRLQIEKVDLYQVHWPSPLTSIEMFAEGLALAVQRGLTRMVGVSNFNKNQTQRAYTVLSKYDIPLASNQVEYSLLNRRIEKNGSLARCHELGIRVIAYSPLAKGLLTGKYSSKNPPPPSRGNTSRHYLENLEKLVAVLVKIGTDHNGKTPGQVALNWTIAKGTLPIPGAKTEKQAIDNAGAIGWNLTEDEVKILDDASEPFNE